MKNVMIVGNFLSSSIGTRSVCEDFAERLKSSDGRDYSIRKERSRGTSHRYDLDYSGRKENNMKLLR